ncbi:MAG: DNA internalization-related competence protein ComEC/Rec2 [Armatimonadota bacterium]|nr:DNA internalization-related competence protein ComEC/Rec2 [Armatimonadota bacterium]MDR7404007.1 DNA internalization-related competence protein ComEC/Rec2 [Armatimonadota bacterium]
MSRPIAHLAAAFALGVALGRGSGLTAWAWAGLLAGAIAAAGMLLAVRRSAGALLVTAAVAAGGLWLRVHEEPALSPALREALGRRVVLTGTVVGPARSTPAGVRVVVAADAVEEDGIRAASGRVLVSVRGGTDIRPGDRVRVRGRLVSPPPAGNPGEFSYRDYLAARGIAALLYADPASARVVGRGRVNSLIGAADAVRRRLTTVLRDALPGRRGAILISLLLGDDGALDDSTVEAFTRSGLLHVLVVSGAQVGLVLAAVLWLTRLLRAPPAASSAVAAGAVAFFALMAGWVPSVFRATVGALAGLAAAGAGRPADPAAGLALAALALLVTSPALLFDAGAQLSFAAAWALIVLAPAVASRLAAPRLADTLVVSTACAQAAVAPLLAYHFQQIPVAGLVANVAALPLVAVLVPAGFAVACAGAVLPALALAAAPPLAFLLDALWAVASAASRLPLATVAVPAPSAAGLLACYLVLALLAGWARGGLRLSPGTAAPAAALALAAALWLRLVAAAAPPHLVVTFLDVGQGDAIVVRAPSGRVLLVDGGGEVEGRITGYDIGARRVVPALRRLGVRSVDVVVLTHAHEDHVGGLPAVVQNFPIGLVLDAGVGHPAPSYPRFVLAVRARGLDVIPARRGGRLELGGGVVASILNPPDPPVEGTASDVNANSVVLRVRYGALSVLLTGDIDALTEADLVRQGRDLRSAVLKAAHHGSATSSSPEFLRAVSPRVAVISVGPRNPFGHPHPAAVDALLAQGAAVYRTDRHGAVTVVTDGRQMWVCPTRHAAEP